MIKRWCLLILSFTILSGCVPIDVGRMPEQVRYYNKQGTFMGYSYDYGHTTRFYSRDGKFIGTSRK